MQIERDYLWFCVDCLLAAVNGDEVEDSAQLERIYAGLTALGPHLVPNFDAETGDGIYEFSWRQCDCCGSRLGGSRHRFATLKLR